MTDSYSLDAEIAATKLIQVVSELLLKSLDMEEGANTVQHLLTRVARRVWIIFYYGITEKECEPSVKAFDIRSNGPRLIVKKIRHPGLQTWVNETVKASRNLNAKFPSRTDLRKNKTSWENARCENSSLNP